MPVETSVTRTEPAGKTAHCIFGLDFPALHLTGVLRALAQRGGRHSLALSLTRGLAVQRVVEGHAGQFPAALGLTGTTVKSAFQECARAALAQNVALDLRAEHVILAGSAHSQSQRGFLFFAPTPIDSRFLPQATSYLDEALDEATAGGQATSFAIGAPDLVHGRADELDDGQTEASFEQLGTPTQRRSILRLYAGKPFTLGAARGKAALTIRYSTHEVMRLALKYWDALNRVQRIHQKIVERMAGKPFDLEIDFLETEQATAETELFFFLQELARRKIPFASVAPNPGIQPFQNYPAPAAKLRARLNALAAVIRHFDGALMTVTLWPQHKTAAPPGREWVAACVKAAQGLCNLRVSHLFFETTLKLLEGLPPRSPGYNVYSRIFDGVERYLKDRVEPGDPLYSPRMRELVRGYNEDIRKLKLKPRDLSAAFFRRYALLALNLRDSGGRRFLRQALLDLYQTDKGVRARIDAATEKLALELLE